MLSFFILIETIWPKNQAEPLQMNEKGPLPVDVLRSKTSLFKLPNDFYRNGDVDGEDGDDDDYEDDDAAYATDETKLWLLPSAKQRRNPCSGTPPVY